jgi:hypothetical protein
MRHTTAMVGAGLALLHTGLAVACPDCPAARLTRAQVCDRLFAGHLAATLAPLAILVGLAWLSRRLGRGPRRAP